jgi:molybdopterin-binding protein
MDAGTEPNAKSQSLAAPASGGKSVFGYAARRVARIHIHMGRACRADRLACSVNPKEHAMKISARNVLPGKVISIVRGPVTIEVTLEIAPGVQVVSTITSSSAQSLQLTEGANAYAVIKASSVMVGTD